MKPAYKQAIGTAAGPAVLAAATSLALVYVVRLLLRVPTPAELLGDRLTVLIPLPVFSALLATFGSNAKHLLFGGLVAGEAVVTAALGIAYWVGREAIRSRRAALLARYGVGDTPAWTDGAVLVAALYLVTLAVITPLLGGGFFGSSLIGGAPSAAAALLLPIAGFVAVYVWLLRRELATQQRPQSAGNGGVTRRRLIRDGAFAVAVLGGGALAWEFISAGFASGFGLRVAPERPPNLSLSNLPARIIPPPTPNYGAWTDVAGATPEVTSAAEFYYVSKDILDDPRVDGNSWRLQVKGFVDHPYALTLAQLKALTRVERYHTLECISNEVGGPLMSNALFAGARLADILNRAGVKVGAAELVFEAADGYSDSLHLSQAIDARALVVYEINGQPLPTAHGYPARLLIPGLYGMKNGKWLTALTVSPSAYVGYWEQRGWTPEARAKTATRIDTPHDADPLEAKPTLIAGVAFAADRGIARVDVSVDGGGTWREATLKRPVGDLTWVLWELPWTPTSGGYFIVARAVELSGDVQTPIEAPPLPDGSSGYHAIHVVVH